MSKTITNTDIYSWTAAGYRQNGNHLIGSPESHSYAAVSTRTGSGMPGFRSKISKAQNATTNLSAVKRWVELHHEQITIVGDGPGGIHPDGTLKAFGPLEFSWPTNSTPDLAKAKSLAAARFYKEARDAMTSMNGMTFLGELREAMQLVKRPVSSLRRGIDKYLVQAKQLKRVDPKSLPKLWLEYAFGWAPLFSDANSAFDAIDRLNTGFYTKTISASELVEGTSRLSGSYLKFQIFNMRRRGLQNHRCRVIYRGAVKLSPPGTRAKVMNEFGFKPDEFIPTVWELLPWSFLIDYFTNVGDIVGASSFCTANLAWSCETIVIEKERHQRDILNESAILASYPDVVSMSGVSQFSSFTKQVERKKLTPPTPEFHFEIPGLGTKWLNIAALIAARRT